jgi:hypothetical protein
MGKNTKLNLNRFPHFFLELFLIRGFTLSSAEERIIGRFQWSGFYGPLTVVARQTPHSRDTQARMSERGTRDKDQGKYGT